MVKNLDFLALVKFCAAHNAPTRLKLHVFDNQYDLRSLLTEFPLSYYDYARSEYADEEPERFMINVLMLDRDRYDTIKNEEIPGLAELDASFPAKYAHVLTAQEAANKATMDFKGAAYEADDMTMTAEFKAVHDQFMKANADTDAAIRDCETQMMEHIRQYLLSLIED